jgi:protein SCO1/2
VRFVFVTVDPERDTPDRLGHHVETFNPDFIGLTGAPQALEPVYRTFGIYNEKDATTDSAAGYLVNHTASIFVVDRDGQWRLRHIFGTSVEDIVHDVRHLLK